MGATFSRVKTWLAAQTLTAADLNAEFDNILNNLIPAGLDDESASDAAMQAVADPYPGSVISKPTSLTGELQRIRYILKQLSGATQWYIDPGAQNFAYATVASHATTSAIWAAAGNVINFTGTETLTDLPAAPQAGAQRTLICAGACIFTHAGALTVQGGATYTAAAGDVIIVTATSTTTFKINILNQASKPAILLAGTAGKTITCTQNISLDAILTLSRLVLVDNLKPVVNGTVNLLDVFTKSGGAVPDATNIIAVAIPDGNGYTFRSRNGAVASGTGQIAMADAGNYWSKGSLDAEIKTAYLYAIWSTADGGLVWALGGYSGFTRVPASVTATDDDFFLLETSSSYTKVVTDYCVCVGKIRYQYDTADAPDHTIQATVLNAPQVIWNPKSDYAKSIPATAASVGSDIAIASVASFVAKQSGLYMLMASINGGNTLGNLTMDIKVGSSTYASAVSKTGVIRADNYGGGFTSCSDSCLVYINAGDTVHLGIGVTGTAAENRVINANGSTLTAIKAD